MNSDNSYLRDILGDILGKDMHYPFTRSLKLLVHDEASNHEDASDTRAAPKQQPQVIPQTTAISNIKFPILKKEEYNIWAMEMEHYLEYIDNDVWKVIQNGNSKKRISTEERMGVIRHTSTKEDSTGKPLYSRFIKTNDFKGVPHPLSGDYTPTPQEEIDESLYVYGKKGPQKPEPSVSDDRSSEYSTCQSNDSARSIGTSSEHSVDSESEISRVPQEVYVSKPITTNEKGVSAPKSKEVEPSCVSHIKTPRQPIKDQETPKVNRKNWNAMMERELGEGYSFTKKKCFVCGSLSHLIKDCDYYEKKMAREAEFKKQRVFNTGNRVAKPVWTNANRVNHANQFVPKPVQLNAGRAKINSVRPNINTGRTNVNSVRPRVSTVSSNVNTVRSRQPVPTRTSNSFSPKRPQVNQFNQRRHFSKSYSPVRRPIDRNTTKMSYFNAVKGNWGTAVKTSAGYNWRNSSPNSNCDSGPTFIRTDHPLKNMEDRGIFDSGCSGHMTGNKDHLDDFEECKGGSVTFGGKIIVVTLVEEQMSPWKGNLPKLPIESNYSLMAYSVTILTSDSTRSCVMQSTLPTKGMRSIISMVSISLEGFLPSILLLMITVVIVAVILVVIVVVIVGVGIVVAIIGVVVEIMIIGIVVVVSGVSSIIKLSFVIIGFLHRITLYYLIH
ncbi:hypothetical protein Tco_1474889 [Tanacetum coccineum]